ncbi:MAG: hypothetical protein GWN62_02285 [Aliifodinibius sp.]|nr:hypothetical protein [Fodinibius sp.]
MARNFDIDPRYQRLRQRIEAMTPQERALFNMMNVEKQMAAQEMRKNIDLMNLGTQRYKARKGLELREKEFAGRYGLAEDRLDWAKKEADIALPLGLFTTGFSIYQAQKDKKRRLKERARYEGLINRYDQWLTKQGI